MNAMICSDDKSGQQTGTDPPAAATVSVSNYYDTLHRGAALHGHRSHTTCTIIIKITMIKNLLQTTEIVKLPHFFISLPVLLAMIIALARSIIAAEI